MKEYIHDRLGVFRLYGMIVPNHMAFWHSKGFRMAVVLICLLPGSLIAQVFRLPLESDTRDVTGNGHHAELVEGEPRFVPSGRCGAQYTLALDGRDDNGYDMYSIPSMNGYRFENQMSISVWVRPLLRDNFKPSRSCAGGSLIIATQDIGQLGGFQLGFWFIDPIGGCDTYSDVGFIGFSGKLEDGSGINMKTPHNLKLGELYFAVFVYSGTETILYLDGQEVGRHPATNAPLGNLSNQLYIGSRGAVPLVPTSRADLGDLRMYDRALSTAEVLEMYRAGLPPDQPSISFANDRNRLCEDSVVIAVDNVDASVPEYRWLKDGQPLGEEGSLRAFRSSGKYSVMAYREEGCTSVSEPVYAVDCKGCLGDSRESDSLALDACYEKLNGPAWRIQTGWDGTAPLSGWQGVALKDGRVSSLRLPENGLSGIIPSELGCLNRMEEIDLSGNALDGNVSSLERLNVLADLKLNDNPGLSVLPEYLEQTPVVSLEVRNIGLDAFPEEIPLLSGLERLDISENRIEALPASLGGLALLGYLDISYNLLEELPAELDGLTGLETFRAGHNRIYRVEALFDNAPSLTNWELDSNRVCELPDSLFAGLDRMRTILLDGNRLSDLPASMGRMTGIGLLGLSDNRLTFSDLIPFVGIVRPGSFYYAPQSPVDGSLFYRSCGTISLELSATIDATVVGNQYQWLYREFHGQSGGTISGENGNKLAVDRPGYFYYLLSNPALPELTLRSGDRIVEGEGGNGGGGTSTTIR